MLGIDLNKHITYKHASFRYFEKKEYHVTRFCQDNVLLLVFDGVLRFTENDNEIEVGKGEYYIQRKNCYQSAKKYSDEPKYLYVHFDGEWANGDNVIEYKGNFDVQLLYDLMAKIDLSAHKNESFNDMQYLFLKLLLSLRKKSNLSPLASKIIGYVENNLKNVCILEDLCKELNYSKNYVIRIFNKEFNTSPIQYVNDLKIKRAIYLLETTSKPVVEIASDCGFSDYPYFYKRFIKKTGVSPLKWRKNIQKNPVN